MGINSKGTLQYPHTLSSPFAFQLELNIMGNWPILIFLVSWKIMKLQLTHVLNKTHVMVNPVRYWVALVFHWGEGIGICTINAVHIIMMSSNF